MTVKVKLNQDGGFCGFSQLGERNKYRDINLYRRSASGKAVETVESRREGLAADMAGFNSIAVWLRFDFFQKSIVLTTRMRYAIIMLNQ